MDDPALTGSYHELLAPDRIRFWTQGVFVCDQVGLVNDRFCAATQIALNSDILSSGPLIRNGRSNPRVNLAAAAAGTTAFQHSVCAADAGYAQAVRPTLLY